MFCFDSSLLPLWSLSWIAQSIAKHNTNKKWGVPKKTDKTDKKIGRYIIHILFCNRFMRQNHYIFAYSFAWRDLEEFQPPVAIWRVYLQKTSLELYWFGIELKITWHLKWNNFWRNHQFCCEHHHSHLARAPYDKIDIINCCDWMIGTH